MRIFYDTEFIEDGTTVDLISIGMVRDDGAELYAVNADAPWGRITCHEWLTANVVPSLPTIIRPPGVRDAMPWRIDRGDPTVRSRQQIARAVQEFLDVPDPQLWAYYAAYDHVTLCQLWGTMMDLPDGVPMWTHDLMQECERHGNPRMPEQVNGEHNALADARHVRYRYDWLQARS